MANQLSCSEDGEPMDEDTTGEEAAPSRNGDVSKYNLDTYDQDDGPASSASGYAVFGITTIYPIQLLVPLPT
jgi:hypothetical protein